MLSDQCPGPRAEYLVSGTHSSHLSGTLTEQLAFCVQTRGTLTCLEETQEQGRTILGGSVSGVSLCACTGPPTHTLLPESQGASVSRACAEILTLHLQCNMPCHGCIYPLYNPHFNMPCHGCGPLGLPATLTQIHIYEIVS